MKPLLSIVVVVVLMFVADGKRFRRDLSERSLPDTVHFMTTSDVDDVQCLLDTTPNCWKRAYVKDLVDDLDKIGEIYRKLKTFNWYTGTAPEFEEYEKELREDIKRLLKLLPVSVGYNEESQKDVYLFDQVLIPCLEEYLQIDFNDNTLVDFEAARQKAIQHFVSCESAGFDKAKDALGNISSDDWNTAFKIDAFKSEHIQGAAQALLDKYSNENTDGDGQVEARRSSLINEVISEIEADKASKAAIRKAQKPSLPLARESVRKTVSSVRRGHDRRAGYLSERTKLKQQLAELLSNGRDFD